MKPVDRATLSFGVGRQTRLARRLIQSSVMSAAALLLIVGQANALWTAVSANNSDSCDPLMLGPTSVTHQLIPVDELGVSVDFWQADEGVDAKANLSKKIACKTSFVDQQDLQGDQIEIILVNRTTRTFSDLWYVADSQTSISNADGIINKFSAFKIDGTVTPGLNNPLISESGVVNELFEPGEKWVFVVDKYANSLGTSADALASVGVGAASGDAGQTIALSSGSIIALVPEPSTALLMGLGLSGLSLAGRRKPRCRKIKLREPTATVFARLVGSFHDRTRERLLPALCQTWVAFLIGTCLLSAFSPSAAAYSTLTGSGPHVAAPSPNPDPFYTSHSWTNVRIPDPQNSGFLVFDPPPGTTLKNPWQGNFQQTAGGPMNSAAASVDLHIFNFAGLNGDPLAPGTLAAESLISINDLDQGDSTTTNEWLRLTAYDSNNSVIHDPWLSTLVEVSGNPNGNSDPLPGWNWDGNSYLFDTLFVGIPNPGMLIRMITLTPIAELHFDKGHRNFSVGFGAQIEPIPEPSTALLFGLGLVAMSSTRCKGRSGRGPLKLD